MSEPTIEDLEQEAWMVVEQLRRSWLEACNGGYGSPGLREAADALTESQDVLARDRGRRQLRDEWYDRAAASD